MAKKQNHTRARLESIMEHRKLRSLKELWLADQAEAEINPQKIEAIIKQHERTK
jgi:hypothetical protein